MAHSYCALACSGAGKVADVADAVMLIGCQLSEDYVLHKGAWEKDIIIWNQVIIVLLVS